MTDELSQAKGRDNVKQWIKSVSTPPQYIPKIMPIKKGFFRELYEFLADGWRYMAIATLVWFVLLCLFLLTFQPLGN